MPKSKPGRKALFRAALAVAGLTAKEWAAEAGVTAGWLSMILNEKDESITLTEKIDAFIAKQFDGHKPRGRAREAPVPLSRAS